jgi:hypothetical protein
MAQKPNVSVAKSNPSDDKDSVTVIQFSDSGQNLGSARVKKVHKTDAEWKQQLSPLQYEVTRQARALKERLAATYDTYTTRGLYRCICCDKRRIQLRNEV